MNWLKHISKFFKDEEVSFRPYHVRIKQMHNDSLASELRERGFFKYVDPSDMEDVLAKAKEYGALFLSETKRWHSADAEDLCEGDIKDWLIERSDILASFGVTRLEVDQEIGDSEYSVQVNGKTYRIYELTDQVSMSMAWFLSMIGLVNILNSLLEGVSEERAYLIAHDNDAQVIFLTPEMFEIVVKHPSTNKFNRPYTGSALLAYLEGKGKSPWR